MTLGEFLTLEYGKGLREYNSLHGKYTVYGTNGPIGTTNEYLFDRGGIIVGRKGAYRGIHYSEEPFFVIDTAFYINPKGDELISLKFLFYFLCTININAMDSGSAIPSTSRDEFYQIPISLPPLHEQRAIAAVLSSLDEKIELLREQNKTLEETAQAIFGEWFGDNEEREKVKLEDLIEFVPKEKVSSQKEYLFFDMKCLASNSMILSEGIKRKTGSASSFRENDTLMAKITPCLENGKTGFVLNLLGEEIARGSTEFIVMRAKNSENAYFVYCLARNENFRGFAIKSMNGTSGRQRVQIDLLKHYKTSIPKEGMKKFESVCKPVFTKVKNNFSQIQTLSILRDALLPRLMRGALRVKNLTIK